MRALLRRILGHEDRADPSRREQEVRAALAETLETDAERRIRRGVRRGDEDEAINGAEMMKRAEHIRSGEASLLDALMTDRDDKAER